MNQVKMDVEVTDIGTDQEEEDSENGTDQEEEDSENEQKTSTQKQGTRAGSFPDGIPTLRPRPRRSIHSQNQDVQQSILYKNPSIRRDQGNTDQQVKDSENEQKTSTQKQGTRAGSFPDVIQTPLIPSCGRPPLHHNNPGQDLVSWVNSKKYKICFFVVAVVAFIGYLISPYKSSTPTTLEDNINNLKKAFSNQIETTWDSLQLLTEEPTIMLLYDNSKTETECIIDVIKTHFEGTTQTHGKTILLKKTNLDLTHPSDFIETYKGDFEISKLMVIYDLIDFPLDIISSMHSFCDRYNPLVVNGTVLITMKVDKQTHKGKTPGQKAKNVLESHFHDQNKIENLNVKKHSFDAVVTRVLQNVIEIRKESPNFKCPKNQ